MMWSAAFANAPILHPHTLTAAPSSWRSCSNWRHSDNSGLVHSDERFLMRPRPGHWGVPQQSGSATGGDAGESEGEEEEEEVHRDSCSSSLDNPRLPVPNEYLAGWALTQNDTACLTRLQDTMPSFAAASTAASSSSAGGDSLPKSWFTRAQKGSGEREEGLWGETTFALMERVDITRDVDQRRLATSRYWQRLQENPPAASVNDDEARSSLSWEDVSSKFEQDADFVRQEKERLLEEAAMGICERWREDRTSRAWVASYRLSVFETRRQAQLFFSWAIPDEGALDCILEPGKRVVEVGSGLGYWAYLLKMRSGDDSRVRCFDPFAPEIQVASTGGGDSSAVEFSAREQNFSSEAKVDDVWFGEGRAPFAPAERGSFEKIAEHPECYRGWSLLVCWPSDGEWPEGCLRTFRGDDFFFVGEAEGGATRMPWRLMREEWKLERRVEIPRWPGFHDALWWYRRRGAAPLPRAR